MKTPKAEIDRRLQAIRQKMADAGVCYLITGSTGQTNHRGMLRYFTDYYISVFEEYLLMQTEGPTVFFAHDGCAASYMQACESVDEIRYIPMEEYNTRPGKCVGEYLKGCSAKKVAYAGFGGLSANFLSSLAAANPTMELVCFDEEVWALRMVKSPFEQQLSRDTIKLNEDVYRYFLDLVKVGGSEMEAIDAAGAYGWKLHAEDQYWLTDTAQHPCWRPLPLARQKQHIWQAGDVTGIVLEHSAPGGHYSEVARHISLGKPEAELTEAYAVLRMAQDAAFAVMKPGNTVGAVAQAAERVLRESFFGQYLNDQTVAGMGHGQGLDIWEYPQINRKEQTILTAGMRLNLHPNARLSDGAMINCCELYLVTETSAEKLSSLPTELDIVE